MTSASVSRPGLGFGGLVLNAKWCDKEYVKRHFCGEPRQPYGEKDHGFSRNNEGAYWDEEGVNLIKIGFAADGTIKRPEYKYICY